MPEQVQIVHIDAATERRRQVVRRITMAIAAVNGLAAAGAVVPLVNNVAGVLTIGALLAAVAMLTVRWVTRRVRWWLEDRADTQAAAAWHVEHAAHRFIGADTDQVTV